MKIQRFIKNHKKQFFVKNRKGELTTKQLVTIIILIVSFIIILFLIFRLNLGETSNKEICHNSVILKGRTEGLIGSLDCRTNYLCISGGKDCKGISATSTIKIDMSKSSEKIKNEIMKALVDEMADCWWMFGEGKINYGGGFLNTKVYYAICSRIVFDEKIQEKIPTITYREFYDYLAITKKTNTQTYLQYLYATNIAENLNDGGYFKFNLADSIDTSQGYSVITGIDMNLKILFIGNDDKVLNTFIIPTAETGSRLVENREFVTKT